MPIYEYRCSSCGHELEALQKFSDAPLVACPSCKADALVKKVSAAGFQLKGTGWYATDFKSGAGKPSAKAEGADAKPDAKPDAKGDGKPAAAAEAPSASGAGTEAKAADAAPAAGTGAPPASA